MVLTTEAMGSQKDSLGACKDKVSEQRGTSETREGDFLAFRPGDRGPGRSKALRVPHQGNIRGAAWPRGRASPPACQASVERCRAMDCVCSCRATAMPS